jgi:aspartate aminotransferase
MQGCEISNGWYARSSFAVQEIVVPGTDTTVARRLVHVAPSPTIAVTRLAQELKAAGRDVIGLAAGEPDFDTPDFIQEAAIKAIRDGQTRYTAVDGTVALKQAIVDKFKRENNLTFARHQISVGAGGKQVIYNAIMATVSPGDEVIIPTPYWVSYPDMVNLAEGKPVFVTGHPENDFKIAPHDLEKVLTSRTKWLILNAPGNPSGSVYTLDELRALAEVLLRHPKVFILTDDIYEHIVYDGRAFATLASVVPELADRVLTVNGVSKAYNMTGWRIGYAGGPVWLIKKMAEIQSHSTSNPCSISQAAAVAALTGPQEFRARQLAVFQERRDLVVAMLNQLPGVECSCPAGAFYVFPRCPGLIGKKTPQGSVLANDGDVVTYFLEEEGVAMVQGAAFGHSPAFRISYATSTEALREACGRLARAVGKLTL